MNLTKNKRGVYHASFKTAAGQRRTITTKQTDLSKAKAVVKEAGLEELEQAGQVGRLTSEVIGRITTGKRITVENAMDPFRQWMTARGRSPKTTENAITSLQAWAREVKIETLPPAAVTPKHVSEWINADRERTRASRLVVLGHIHTFFSYCASQGWITSDPSQAVCIDHSVLSHEQKEAVPREPFSRDELEKLISYLKSQINDVDMDRKRVEEDVTYTPTGR